VHLLASGEISLSITKWLAGKILNDRNKDITEQLNIPYPG
jgi:hypothetical protein